MAKTKKRAAARKKSSKRGKASAKPARKKAAKRAPKAAKRAAPKKVKSRARRANKGATKPAAVEKRVPAAETKQAVAEVPVETTIITTIEERAPAVVVVEEHQPVRAATPASPDGGLERSEGTGPAGHVDVEPELVGPPEQKVA